MDEIKFTQCCICGKGINKDEGTPVMKTEEENELRIFPRSNSDPVVKEIVVKKSLGWKCAECITDKDISREDWLAENPLFTVVKEIEDKKELESFWGYVSETGKRNVSPKVLKEFIKEKNKKK